MDESPSPSEGKRRGLFYATARALAAKVSHFELARTTSRWILEQKIKNRNGYIKDVRKMGLGMLIFATVTLLYLAAISQKNIYANFAVFLGAGGIFLIGLADTLLATGKVSHCVWYPPNRYLFSPINRLIPLTKRNQPFTRFLFFVFSGLTHGFLVFLLARANAFPCEKAANWILGTFYVFSGLGILAAILAAIQKARKTSGKKPFHLYL